MKKLHFHLKAISDLGPCVWDGEDILLENVACLERSGPLDLTFLRDRSFWKEERSIAAGACFIREQDRNLLSSTTKALVVDDPWISFIHGLRYLESLKSKSSSFIHKTAVIHEEAFVHPSCSIGAGVVIHQGVFIQENCVLESGAVIGPDVTMKKGCVVGSGCVIAYSDLEEGVVIKPGAKIGQKCLFWVSQSSSSL